MCLLHRICLLAPLALALSTAPAAHAEERPPDWEGALGLLTHYGPAYSGSDENKSKFTPGFYLRYGRFSITNASGFITRRNDEVVRGLGIDLTRRDTLRVSLGLRFDSGRSDSDSSALNGLGNVKATVRARIAARWQPDDDWRLGASWSVDAFGRGGGNFGEFTLAREHRFSPRTTGQAGVTLAVAGDRYLQTYYGISAEQAARTGYREYQPSAGLRDAMLFANMRMDLSDHYRGWVLLAGASATRLLGPAADSPLTRRVNSFGLSGGLAYNF
jgi:outer membrane scaffolding protein for murein synthesis (MipA/OmpV family)